MDPGGEYQDPKRLLSRYFSNVIEIRYSNNLYIPNVIDFLAITRKCLGYFLSLESLFQFERKVFYVKVNISLYCLIIPDSLSRINSEPEFLISRNLFL